MNLIASAQLFRNLLAPGFSCQVLLRIFILISVLLSLSGYCEHSSAEYRVYQLLIINVDTQAQRTVISNLDQYQYPDYHPVQLRERVDLVTHWMCWNRTSDFKEFCPQPPTQPPTQQPIKLQPQDLTQSPAQP